MEVEELIRVKREKLQLERMTKELEITMMDTTNLDPEQQQCISQLCQEIIQRQEKSNWRILLQCSTLALSLSLIVSSLSLPCLIWYLVMLLLCIKN